ncbi:MAG: hypothetical protein ACHP7P_13570 [Terriglobales bacterium]
MAKIVKPADALAREYTEEAIQTIRECMQVFDARVALEAAKAMLDRGHGKPLTAVIQVPMAKRLQSQLNALSDDQLLEAIEAEFEELPKLPAPGAAAEPLLLASPVDDPLLA